MAGEITRADVPPAEWFTRPELGHVFRLWVPHGRLASMRYDHRVGLYRVTRPEEHYEFIDYDQAVDYLLELHHRNTIAFALEALGIKP